ncbi:glycosyltransferase family 2 protein [Microcoleus sp. FACHB-68]|uniref:glycosyltransferase family 2 protein n=1 Tax=Microcoleus sp. FACHB-68 TaxID=2692826 RepID=UPI0016820375|nr:glycosyltransferase family 2 protein [Microcoleus sp. FACHB-68]MBD1940077.1 glycosyltransferase [Microcoleus sp. FACHB-68]
MNLNSESPAKPVLSLCMIVKNESKNLPRCLASAKPYVDEMIVVDTGSQDNTPEIAEKYGAQVSYFEWCDDFAAARNYSIAQASGDWILVFDADEELVVESEKFLEQISSPSEIIAYFLTRTEKSYRLSMTPLVTPRLFRNLPGIRFEGKFHEQLKYNDQYISNYKVSVLESISILHYGYGEEELEQKNFSRNIPILERIRREEGLSLMLLYCLSGMYNDMQQPEKAQECCAEAFERLFPNLLEGNPPEDFLMVPSLLYTLGAQSLNQNDYETARLISQRGLEWCPQYPPLNYLAGMTLMALGFPLGACVYLEKCIQIGREGSYYQGEPFEQSFITTDPSVGLGLAYLHLKRWTEAAAAFEQALSFNPSCLEAKENLEKIRGLLTT